MNTKKLLSTIGGALHVAATLKIKPMTVYKWCERGIPETRWYDLVRHFGVSLEKLSQTRNQHKKNR
jgi:hypothetical protein